MWMGWEELRGLCMAANGKKKLAEENWLVVRLLLFAILVKYLGAAGNQAQAFKEIVILWV
jgi:hypothetical protein